MSSNLPRVLVAAPTFVGMQYCLTEFLSALRSLSYSNHDVLLVDNSDSKDFYKVLQKESGIAVQRLIIKGGSGLKKIVRSRNKIISYALEHGYDFVLMLDADVIVPSNILERLLASRKDIISGMYFNVFTVNNKDVQRPVAWKKLSSEELQSVRSQISDIETVEKMGSVRRHLTPEEWNSGDVLQVYIPSAGCMLVSTDVFKSGVRYGILDTPGNLTTSDDIFFCKEASDRGFKIFCDTSIRCDHLMHGKFKRKGDTLIHPAYG